MALTFAHPLIDITTICGKLFRLEVESDFVERVLHRVGPMYEIAAHFKREIAPDGPHRGFSRERMVRPIVAQAVATAFRAFENCHHHRRGNNVVHQPGEERLSFMYAVVPFRQIPIDMKQPQRHYTQSATFQPAQHGSDQSALHRVPALR